MEGGSEGVRWWEAWVAERESVCVHCLRDGGARKVAQLTIRVWVGGRWEQQSFSAQGIANMANALVRMKRRDFELMKRLSDAALLLPASAFTVQDVSVIMNALAHLSYRYDGVHGFVGHGGGGCRVLGVERV